MGNRIAGALLMGTLGLAGCGSQATGAPSDPDRRRVEDYRCEGGRHARVELDRNGKGLTLTMGGRSMDLPRIASATGAAYAANGVRFWNKGPKARLTVDGDEYWCERRTE